MDNNNILLTIGIPNYNYEKYIAETIQTVVNQKGNDLEILISDNCSTDSSWAIINQYNDTRIRKWQQPENIGMIKNWNFLLQNAKGRYFLLLPSDDLLSENFFDCFRENVSLKTNIFSTIIWGYSSFKNDFSNIGTEKTLPIQNNIPLFFEPIKNPDLIIEAMMYSAPWCHAQNTSMKKNAGGYKLETFRSDTRSFIDTLIKNLGTPILSINNCISFQRNHDNNIRNFLHFEYLFKDNITIANQLIKINNKKSVKNRLISWKRMNYAWALSFILKLLKKMDYKRIVIFLKYIYRNSILWELLIWGFVYLFNMLHFKIFVNTKKEKYLNL